MSTFSKLLNSHLPVTLQTSVPNMTTLKVFGPHQFKPEQEINENKEPDNHNYSHLKCAIFFQTYQFNYRTLCRLCSGHLTMKVFQIKI